MAINTDPAIDMVMKNIRIVVESEGGSLDFVEVRDGRLTVEYKPGVNEDCPECVPDHDLVRQMFNTSISTYAPYIKAVEVL